MQIAIPLYPGFTGLDAIGPYQVFASVPGLDVMFTADSRGPVTDDAGHLTINAERAFDELTEPDVVVVPGGLGTRRIAADRHPVVDWVQRVHPTATWTMSVCTGALVLGAAGLLAGRRATTHWIAFDDLASYGATPVGERVVIDGTIATAAGVSAGIDLALTMAGRIWGPEIAQAVQLGIEYDPQPPYDSGSLAKAAPEIRDIVALTMRDLIDVATG